LSELVVDSADGYLRKAVELAADSAGLRELSNQLNTALEGSRDSGVFVGKLETAYQDLWAAQIAGTLAPGVVHRTDGR
jgi:predicted O-linked N-acetylglucosamine transferase (SPINDLY family)